MKRYNIACIVVTFNRSELLKRCIESLRIQTYREFDIYVVNNGSTDNTKSWLDKQEDINAIHQENVGGAGGFYIGMKTAYDMGYDWIWMMDDDGVADTNQIFELYHRSLDNDIVFANALVCNINNYEELSFGLSDNGSVIYSTKVAQKSLLWNAINPFNGTFINKVVIEKIGFIKKEMFIWGDETEYTLRAMSNGFVPRTITSAIQYHPKIKGVNFNVIPFWNKYNINVKPAKLSHVYYRNLGYIYKTYMPSKFLIPVVLYSILFLRKFNILELAKFYKYYFMGGKGIFL